MGLIFLLLFIILIANSVAHANRMMLEQQKKLNDKVKEVKDDKADFIVEKAKADYVVEDVKKFCPPHKWRYQEVRDTEGNTVRWRIICDLCGPLKPMGGPARLE